eukprot:6179648-Lingulodinium_polyedra.AAC.1
MDLEEAPVGSVLVHCEHLAITFEIPVWRQDQLESVKLPFSKCIAVALHCWLWTRDFAIYYPEGLAEDGAVVGSLQRGDNR